MTASESLTTMRNQYPATTSAAYTLMMCASELRRSRDNPHWVDLNGRNLSEVRFERSFSQVLDCAHKETGICAPRDLLKFVNGFLSRIASVCYGCELAFDEIRQRELKEGEVPQMLANVPLRDISHYAPFV